MPKAVRVVLWIVIVVVAVLVLFTYVFPWVEQQQQDPTLGQPAEPVPEIVAQLTRSPR